MILLVFGLIDYVNRLVIDHMDWFVIDHMDWLLVDDHRSGVHIHRLVNINGAMAWVVRLAVLRPLVVGAAVLRLSTIWLS